MYNYTPNDILSVIVNTKQGDNLSKRLLYEIFENPKSTGEERQFLLQFSIFNYEVDRAEMKGIISGNNFDSTLIDLQDKLMIKSLKNLKYGTHTLIREFCYAKLNSEDKKNYHLAASEYYIKQRNAQINLSLEEKIFHHYSSANDTEKIEETVMKLGHLFILNGHLQLLQRMISAIQTPKEENKQVINLLEGEINWNLGAWDKSIESFKAAIINDSRISMEAEIKMAEVYIRRGEFYDVAEQIIERCYDICLKKKYENFIARCLNDKGIIKQVGNNNTEALKFYKEALKVAEDCNDLMEISDAHTNLSFIFHREGLYEESVASGEKALQCKKQLGDKFGEIIAYSHLCSAYAGLYENDSHPKVKEYLDKALALDDTSNNKAATGILLNKKAHFFTKDTDEALKLVQQALEIDLTIGNPGNIASSYHSLGAIYLLRKFDLIKAKENLEKANYIFKGIEDVFNIIYSSIDLARVYFKEHDYANSLKYALIAIHLAKLYNPKIIKIIRNHIGNLQVNLGSVRYNAILDRTYKNLAEKERNNIFIDEFKFFKHYQTLKVQFSDGRIEKVKYKKIVNEIQNGECTVIQIL